MPPADTEFVRFTGEEVTQLKIMKIDGQKVVKTQREVTLDEPTIAARRTDGPDLGPNCNVPPTSNPTEADGTPRVDPPGTIRRTSCKENASVPEPPPAPGAKRPTLRRPGEAIPDNEGNPVPKTVASPNSTTSAPPGDVPDQPTTSHPQPPLT
jgi:hypothetical protein